MRNIHARFFSSRIGFGVQETVVVRIDVIKKSILGVHVMNGSGQFAHRFHWIDALPEKMAGIEICAEHGAGGIAQAQHRLGVINEETGMRLEGDLLHAVIRREFRLLAPIGDDDFVPLPLQDGKEIRRPGAGDPVGILRAGVLSPGQPEKVVTTGTPIFAASFTVAWNTA